MADKGKPGSESIPFDEALRRMLNTPPDHKPRTKTGVPKKTEPPKREEAKDG